VSDWISGRRREWIEFSATLAFISLCVVGILAGIRILAQDRPTSADTEAKAAAALSPRAGGRTPAPTPQLPSTPVMIGDASSRGVADSPVAVVVFTEFKCPFCARLAREIFPWLIQQYVDTGKVRLVTRHYPLDQLHPLARPAAEAAVCADSQGRFWTFHDQLFANQAQFTRDDLAKHAEAAGLNQRQYAACLTTEAPERVREHEALGRTLGVTATPTTFVGIVEPDGQVLLRQRLPGLQRQEAFQAAIERWLAETAASGSRGRLDAKR
jgi:protein-disulfide isomerase